MRSAPTHVAPEFRGLRGTQPKFGRRAGPGVASFVNAGPPLCNSSNGRSGPGFGEKKKTGGPGARLFGPSGTRGVTEVSLGPGRQGATLRMPFGIGWPGGRSRSGSLSPRRRAQPNSISPNNPGGENRAVRPGGAPAQAEIPGVAQTTPGHRKTGGIGLRVSSITSGGREKNKSAAPKWPWLQREGLRHTQTRRIRGSGWDSGVGAVSLPGRKKKAPTTPMKWATRRLAGPGSAAGLADRPLNLRLGVANPLRPAPPRAGAIRPLFFFFFQGRPAWLFSCGAGESGCSSAFGGGKRE